LKRSNRLVLLIGVFLAIVAFIGILILQQPKDPVDTAPTELPTVVATTDIPLGTRISADQVTEQNIAITGRDTDAFGSVTQVIGQIARQNVTSGAAITARTLSGGDAGTVTQIDCPPTKRCMSVQVDQVTGVGTLIKTGDYVDMVVGFQADKFPVITVNPVDDSFTVVSGINSTSVKLLIQGLQVLGTLLPPAPAAAEGAEGEEGTSLTGQQQIVILAADAQQSEIIKFSQLDGSISLALRSPEDFVDPETGAPFPNGPIPDETTGIILKVLVDTYGVLPPELVETILPAQGG
jgi:pilus assembly protein CpaB